MVGTLRHHGKSSLTCLEVSYEGSKDPEAWGYHARPSRECLPLPSRFWNKGGGIISEASSTCRYQMSLSGCFLKGQKPPQLVPVSSLIAVWSRKDLLSGNDRTLRHWTRSSHLESLLDPTMQKVWNTYLLPLLPLSFCWDPVGLYTLGGPPRPSLTGSCRFGEQACRVMEPGCQGNVSSSLG